MSESMRDRVADLLLTWVHEREYVDLPDTPGEVTDAVLAVVADVDGIAAVLWEHFWAATDDKTCECGWLAHAWAKCLESEDQAAWNEAARAFTAHQAEAVAAYLRGAP